VPETNVNGAREDPAQTKVGAAETPTRFVFGRPDGARVGTADPRNAGDVVWRSERCEGAEDLPELAGVVVLRSPAAVRPRREREIDVALAEVGEIDPRRDATEDVGNAAEPDGLTDLGTAAVNCAS